MTAARLGYRNVQQHTIDELNREIEALRRENERLRSENEKLRGDR
jgi:cell division protein FtsB